MKKVCIYQYDTYFIFFSYLGLDLAHPFGINQEAVPLFLYSMISMTRWLIIIQRFAGFCGNYRMLLLVTKVGVLFPDVGGVLAFDIFADDARIRRCYA